MPFPRATTELGGQHPQVKGQVETYVDRLACELRTDGFVVETIVPLADSNASCIVEQAELRHADVVVMATHDRSGPNRWLCGSVAEVVASHSAVPVLLVRSVDGVQAAERFKRERPKLLVALDGSALAEVGLPVVGDLARMLAGEVVLVTAAPTEMDAGEYLRSIAARFAAGGIAADVSVRRGDAAEQIHQAAQDHEATAVIIATHGRTGLARTLMGSVGRGSSPPRR